MELTTIIFYFFAFVLPIFPSDLMCYVAGLATISPKHFLIANILGRTCCAVFVTLIGIYGAFGFVKTFRTQSAQEQMPWARDRSERFIRFVGISELLGALGILAVVFTGGFPWLAILTAGGFSLIQMNRIQNHPCRSA